MGLGKFLRPAFEKFKRKLPVFRYYSLSTKKPPWKILFFGTDEFSLYSLDVLNEEYRKQNIIKNLEVVTNIKEKSNLVQVFSEKKKLTLHKWPPSLIPGQFDVGIVVSFGHLIPSDIINSFEFGMLNIHASLLPKWRGAAPIIYAIAKGDTETGVTIMKISQKKFDVGEIVKQVSIPINPDMKMKELHTILGRIGAQCLIETLTNLPQDLKNARPQQQEGVSFAPKINPKFSFIKWETMSSVEIYNLARALDGAFHIQTTWKSKPLKLFNIKTLANISNHKPGFIEYDRNSKLLKVSCADHNFVAIEKIGYPGKKIMTASDFNNGFLKKEPPDDRFFK